MVKLTKAEKKLLKWQWSDARAILFDDLVKIIKCLFTGKEVT
jgi:hypothetical protein